VLTTRQAAARLGVTPRQVRRYVAAGTLEARPLGDYPTAPLAITEESVERMAQTRTEDSTRRRRRDAAERSSR